MQVKLLLFYLYIIYMGKNKRYNTYVMEVYKMSVQKLPMLPPNAELETKAVLKQEWIVYILTGIEETAEETLRLVKRINA